TSPLRPYTTLFRSLCCCCTFAATHHQCQLRPTNFEGWKAEELSNDWVRLAIVPQLGGRLMQVTFAGHSYLFVNPEYKGQYFPPSGKNNGKWFNYGGDKLWPLPEGRQDEQHWAGPASDLLDDGEYQLTVLSHDSTCAVRLDGPADPVTGLQYSREISIGSDSPQISFHAVMKNATGHPIRWSVQSVTQYDTADSTGSGFNRDFWAFTPVNPQSAYFNGYQVRAGLADDPSFNIADGLFLLHWQYLQNEGWLDATAGWLPVPAHSTGKGVRLFGSLVVLYPGNLIANFYDAHGVESEAPPLQSVDPAIAVELNEELEVPRTAERIPIHLIDDDGKDRGSLAA